MAQITQNQNPIMLSISTCNVAVLIATRRGRRIKLKKGAQPNERHTMLLSFSLGEEQVRTRSPQSFGRNRAGSSLVRRRGMRKLVLLIFTVASLIASDEKAGCEGKAASGYGRPANCGRLECAPYRVVLARREFEVRMYESASWISTPPINSSSYDDAVRRGFDVLFSYIQGNNKQGAKMDMTAPVLVHIFPSTGPFCNSSFVVHFYVPKKYQPDPPLSDQVHAVKLPGRHRYAAVRRFGGFMNDSNIPTQVSALEMSLKAAKEKGGIILGNHRQMTAWYSVAGYNSPFEYENRVNEVILWFD